MRSTLSRTSMSDLPSKKLAEDKKPVLSNNSVVEVVQTVRCPTCGSLAERRLLSTCQTSIGEYCVRTACETCDYLLIAGSLTGRVLEAYAPGQKTA